MAAMSAVRCTGGAKRSVVVKMSLGLFTSCRMRGRDGGVGAVKRTAVVLRGASSLAGSLDAEGDARTGGRQAGRAADALQIDDWRRLAGRANAEIAVEMRRTPSYRLCHRRADCRVPSDFTRTDVSYLPATGMSKPRQVVLLSRRLVPWNVACHASPPVSLSGGPSARL